MISKFKAFTLAEVLITLGIIGIVAALTIPGLISKYHRVVVENKLKKFYSIMNQAVKMSIADNEDIVYMDVSDISDSQNSDKILAWYNEYLLKYLTGVQSKKVNTTYIKVMLNDGTGFVSYMQKISDGNTPLWFFYCLDANDKSCEPESFDGRNTFLFRFSPEQKALVTAWAGVPLERAKQSCYSKNPGSRHGCTELIKQNGWKIPYDYPWIK